MRRINIRDAVGEPVLARPLVDERGAFVLAAGKPLTSGVVERLWERGFRHAYVEARGFEDIEPAEPLSPRLYSRLRRLLGEIIDEVRNVRPGDTLAIPADELDEVVAEACDELAALPKERGFLLYPRWQGRRDGWISFAVNAAAVAALLGLQQGLQSARRLFAAGLLQDVGGLRTDRPQEHVKVTVDLLRPVRGVGPVVKAIAGQHHELLDGSGYPEGKTAEQMHELSPLMQVTVAYLEMVGPGSKTRLPHEALEGLLAGAGVAFSGEAVQLFRRLIPAYPAGTVVRLSGGRRGVVLDPGPAGLNRPKVRILPSSIGRVGAAALDELDEEEALEEYPEVDLAKEFAVMIEAVFD